MEGELLFFLERSAREGRWAHRGKLGLLLPAPHRRASHTRARRCRKEPKQTGGSTKKNGEGFPSIPSTHTTRFRSHFVHSPTAHRSRLCFPPSPNPLEKRPHSHISLRIDFCGHAQDTHITSKLEGDDGMADARWTDRDGPKLRWRAVRPDG